jgi:tetratricopeptide (TPR) repeat protein
LAAGTLLSLGLGALSLWQAQSIKPQPMNWQRMVNGYIRMGDRMQARRLLAEIARDQPDAIGLHELRGLMALQDQDYARAREELEAAIAQRPRRHEVWHNYSVVLEHDGDLEGALAAEARAESMSPLAEYRLRMGLLLEKLDRNEDAIELYRELAKPPVALPDQAFAAQAAARLQAIEATPQ